MHFEGQSLKANRLRSVWHVLRFALCVHADPACGLDSASDTASEFEYISVADAEHQEESASRKRSAREDWPQAGLTKQAKGVDASASAVDFHSAGVDSSLRSSASAPSAVLTNLAGNEQSCEHRSASVVSLADVNLELEHAAPAVCLAAAESADDDLMTDYAESSFESVTSSVASFESLEAMSEVQREREPSGEWEML